MNADHRLRTIALSRHGVMTRSDAHRVGLSDRQIRRRVDAGQLIRRSPGVFVLSSAERTDRQELMVATLVADGAAMERSSAWLLGLNDNSPPRPVVGRADPRGLRHDWLELRRPMDLPRSDLTRVDSIPTTNATRTLLDLAAVTTDDELRILVGRARRLRLTHPDRLVQRFLTFGRRGRPGVARARRILCELEADLALVDSDLESLLLQLVARHGLPTPEVQFPVSIRGRNYRLDMAYPSHRVAIEADGFEFHSGRERFESDRSRQNDLVLDGWVVLRFTWRQICGEPEMVAEQIARALQ